ncbi:MAG: pyruvate carboxylase subunit B [Desulfurococcaceae archaeon]
MYALVEIVDTTLRDAHQSLIATRLKTEDIIPILDLIDKAGFYSIEMWGGATFDVMLRYLKENPWERLRIIRERVKRTKLQMLLRGQNLVGYRHYPDDVVEKFVELAFKNGIDVFRVFDALNDVRNMAVSIKKARSLGAIVQGTITYTVSPVHTLDYYLKLAEEIASLEVDHITIKDMAGLLDPYTTYELVREIKSRLKIPVDVHSHFTGGLAIANYIKAIEAGADFVDTSISPLAFGTGQPGIQSLYYALPPGTRPKVDMDVVRRISAHLEKILFTKYKDLLSVKVFMPDPNVLEHQIPGGMISNFLQQLKQVGAEDKLPEVLEEVKRVREDLGWPPLVTPTSQIVGVQAVLNVLYGRYKVVAKEVRDYVKGLYGRPPAPIKKEVIELVLGSERPIEVRPADLLKPALDDCRKALVEKGFNDLCEEDVVTYCLFPDLALEFFNNNKKSQQKPKIGLELDKEVAELYSEILGA